jgi:hypothetical protein
VTEDWRLQHLRTQPRLRGASFVRKPYREYRTGWDHDHCCACWAKLTEPGAGNADGAREGYATTAGYFLGADYDWICLPCFEEFRDLMDCAGAMPRLSD